LLGSFQVCLSVGAILRRVATSSAYTCIRNTYLPTRTLAGFRHEHFHHQHSVVPRRSSLDDKIQPPEIISKRRSFVYDTIVRGKEIIDIMQGSPEGITTLREKSAVFRDGYRSRPVRPENMGSVCDTRGKVSPKAPHPICQRGPFQRCTTTNGTFVL
jgi:hypothetical protein